VKTIGTRGKINAILIKYYDKSTKIGRYMWIRTANKFAKYHAKRLDQSEHIPKKFFGGYFFSETPCIITNIRLNLV